MISKLNSISRLLKAVREAVRGFKIKIFILTLTGVCSVAASMMFVYFSKQLIDIATGAAPGSILLYSIIIALLLICQILMQSYERWKSTKEKALLTNSLRTSYFNKIINGNWQQSEKFRTGDMQTRLLNDISDLTELIVYSIPGIIISFTELCIAFIFLYILNPVLAFTICMITPCFLFLSKAYFRKIRNITNHIKDNEGKLSTMINESFINRNIIKSFDYQHIQNNNFNFIQNIKLGYIYQKNNYSVISYFFVSLCFCIGYLIAFIWGAWQISLGLITFGTMTAFLQLANRIQSPALELLNSIPAIINTVSSIERLSEIENIETEKLKSPDILGAGLTIEFDNVSFSYENENPVIKNLSLKLQPDTISVLAGESGAGKTTLIRLLLGLVKPDSGEIYFKTENGNKIQISENTRNNFVYVPQGNTLFGTTIRENILLGNPSASDSEIREAVADAAADFIYSLPEGLDTMLTENSSGISQGQAQRIAIARALLRPGSVILLDEATSALDEAAENTILERLKSNKKDKTILFITHNSKIKSYGDVIFNL